MAFARQNQDQSNMIQLAIKGWATAPSKFANDPESGISAIVTFLEKKSQRKIHSHTTAGRRVLLIQVEESDAPRFFHLNNFTFSGAILTVEESKSRGSPQANGAFSQPRSDQTRPTNNYNRQPNRPNDSRSLQNRIESAPSGPRSQQTQPRFNNNQTHPQNLNNQPSNNRQNGTTQPGGQTQEIENIMISVIHKRYNINEKYLTFESLAADPEMQASGLSQQSASKVFAALFTICEKKVWETPNKRREMVTSVSLSNNSISTVKDVIALSATFPHLKNLDLSNNNISDTGDMRFWSRAFRNLEHLILTGNPIDTKPEAKQKLARWYPQLKLINNEPIQPQSAASMALDSVGQPARISSPALPLPIERHPELPEGSMFGMPEPGKSEEQLIKEQMGLRFSYDTHLKMSLTEMCLTAANFNYDEALKLLQAQIEAGTVPSDAYLS